MAIEEDNEEIENPNFSDNSSSSNLTTRLRKFSQDLSKYVDKSDNDSLSGRSGSKLASRGKKLSQYHAKSINETIEEEKEEKEEHQE